MFSSDDQISFHNDTVHHISAGGFLFCKKDNQLFVALIKDQDGKVVIPKGHLKQNEEPLAAAIREIKEELGIAEELKSVGFVEKVSYQFSMPADSRKHQKELFIYALELDSLIELHPLTIEGIAEALWLPIDQATQKLDFYQESLAKAITLFKQKDSVE